MHFLIALGASLVLTPIVRRVGLAAGTVDRPSPGELKIHSQLVPFLGGGASGGAGGPGLALAGSLVGFLAWNRPPARIFLGNGGAYAVGTMLAVLAAEVAVGDGVPVALAGYRLWAGRARHLRQPQ